ncbi:MAG: hypothetical protein KJO82_02085 [Gammaproteobacteria bacterium]|nr:hypothetical protein [Gammaproteobacteria bacterium]
MTILTVTPAELVQRRNSGELWRLLDVREPWETEIVRVDDAIFMPMQELPSRLTELSPEEPLAVLCHTGGRSARVAEFLMHRGFSRVANVTGGIDAWSISVDASLPRY